MDGRVSLVTTKLKPDHSLDLDAIRAGLERLIANGVAGVVMIGMVGENAQLSPEETHRAAHRERSREGRVPIISGLAERPARRVQ